MSRDLVGDRESASDHPYHIHVRLTGEVAGARAGRTGDARQGRDCGEHDLDTLKIIASYRTDQPKEVNFGVYCTVMEPGEAAAGDAVLPIGDATA